MKLFVLKKIFWCGWYEGTNFIGVFDSRDKAESIIASSDSPDPTDWVIYECELNLQTSGVVL